MTFEEVVDQAIAMLQRRGRVTYRMLKRQFNLDDEALEDLKEELIYGQRLALDEDDRVLVGIEQTEATPPPTSASAAALTQGQEREPASYTPPHLAEKILTTRSTLEGERKQVTVLFCDIANSTPLAEGLGPERMHSLLNQFFKLALGRLHTEVKRPDQARQAYRAACEVIDRIKANVQNPELRANLEHSPLFRNVYDLSTPG